MKKKQVKIDYPELLETLLEWMSNRLTEEGEKWVSEKVEKFQKQVEDWEFFSSFSAVPRYTGKKPLGLNRSQKKRAEEIRSGWRPEFWRVDQVGRTMIVLTQFNRSKEEFLDKLEKTFSTADLGESVALYQSLPILPYPGKLRARAAEGVRSNMNSVFDAVALHNPYPAEYFDDTAWNQMVLKALFIGSPLYKIQGLERRRNETLARMLVDYAHERWAANRWVSPELWRPVGPFARASIVDDLEKVLKDEDPLQQQAAALALSEAEEERAKELLDSVPELKQKIEKNSISWDEIGRRTDSK